MGASQITNNLHILRNGYAGCVDEDCENGAAEYFLGEQLAMPFNVLSDESRKIQKSSLVLDGDPYKDMTIWNAIADRRAQSVPVPGR